MTTSAAGLYGNFGQTNYSGAKMGLVGLMNTLKLEGEKHNIKVNTVAPVAVTRLSEDVMPENLKEKLVPEYVAPMTLYLCSEQCEETGMIFNAGMRVFNRAAVLTGPGAIVGDGQTPPTPEQIHQNWAGISNMSGGVETYNATAAIGDILNAFTPKKDVPAKEETGGPSVKAVFDQMPQAFQADKAAGVDVVFQYNISGPGGGKWYATIKDQTCEVSEGTHDKPTTTIIMGDEDFLALMRGELNPMVAYTSGKLKIEGDIMKSQLIEKLFKM